MNLESSQKSSTPKFASFRPRSRPSKLEVPKQSAAAHRRHVQERKSSQRRENQQILDGENGRTQRLPHPDADKGLAETLTAPTGTFIIDRKGDTNNANYGSIDKSSVPTYRRQGAGRILGVARDLRVDSDIHGSLIIVLKDEGARAARGNRSLTGQCALKPRRLRLVTTDSTDQGLELAQEFITLRPKKRRKVTSASSSDGESIPKYRTIAGKEEKSEEVLQSPDTELTSDESDDGDRAFHDAVREQSAILARRVKAEPKNVDAWIELINHQDRLVSQSRGGDISTLTSAERRTTAEVKLSIYQQALKSIDPQTECAERLALGAMEEGTRLWDSTTLATKWSEIMRKHQHSIILWPHYLNFLQTTFAEFRYDQVLEKFQACLGTLTRSLVDSKPDCHLRNKVYALLVYVILRVTRLMHEAGFAENAIAAWQALLEYNFFGDETSSIETPTSDNQSRKGAFEIFWESEVPRIGEPGATGWTSYMTSAACEPAPAVSNPDIAITNQLEALDNWAKLEKDAELKLRNPGRTSDESEEVDPYHVVLFSDINHFLVKFPSDIGHSSLLDAFLHFCGAPLLPSDGQFPESRKFVRDVFLNHVTLDTSDHAMLHWLVKSTFHRTESFREERRLEFASGPRRQNLLSDELITSDRLFSSGSCAESSRIGLDDLSVDTSWFIRALKNLTNAMPEHDRLAEYLLAAEGRIAGIKSVRKTAKALLKRKPSSLRLYNAYGLLEERYGDEVISNGVFSKAINMSQVLGENGKVDSILLFRSWIWQALYRSRLRLALARLCGVAEEHYTELLLEPLRQVLDEAATPIANSASLLKTRRVLTERLQHCLSHNLPFHAATYAECLCLLTYLSSATSADLSAALSAFSTSADLLLSRNMQTANELLQQAKALLIRYHIDHKYAYKPARVREALAESTRSCPHNTMLLKLFAATEARFSIEDPVRKAVRDALAEGDQPSSIAYWNLLVEHEIERAGASQYPIRAIFERAVESSTGKHSAVLWRLYVLWEITLTFGECALSATNPGKTKMADAQRIRTVFLRGLSQLPWCKSYIMLAFLRPMLQILSLEETRKLYDVLVEKELRIRVQINEDDWNRG